MTPTQFWLILGGFLTLIVGWFAAARIYVAVGEWRNRRAIVSATEPDPDDLDAKWDAYWREIEIQRRGTAVWAWAHDTDDAWVREYPGWDTEDPKVWAARLVDDGVTVLTAADTARFDKIETETAARAAAAANRWVKGLGYASVVDMTVLWLHARRRSVKRMVAVLDKTDTWPEEWKRQLQVLLAENAVGRARDEVRTR